MMYFCVILCSLIFTNCIFSLHNIFYYSIFIRCFHPMWSSSGIIYSYNHLDIGLLDSTFPILASVYLW
jgi:hypothetical protein